MGRDQDLLMNLGGDPLLLLCFHTCSEVYLTEEGHLTLGEVRAVWFGQTLVRREEGWLCRS